jgi:hypothetical protein
MNELEESLREYGFRSSVTITLNVDHDDEEIKASDVQYHIENCVSPERADEEWKITVHKTESNATPDDLAEVIAQSVYESMNDHALDVGQQGFQKLRSLGDEATKKTMDDNSEVIMNQVWRLLACKGQ